MKQYPTINRAPLDIPIIAFNKLDGSNIRAEWSRKRGFYKFGTRKQLLDCTFPILGEAPSIIQAKYEQQLSDIFTKERYNSVVCFFEFIGQNSFAGWHDVEPHDCVLFDCSPFKVGLLPPSHYLKLFGHLDIAQPLYSGKANQPFIDMVRNSTLAGMSLEGVVCKGQVKKQTVMFKLKSQAWLDRLKQRCGDDDKLFNELA